MYWDTFEDMKEFQRSMNRAFDAFFNRPDRKRLAVDLHSPLSDVIDKGDHIIVRVGLPGIEKEDIVLSVTDTNIEVRAQKKNELKVQKKGYYKHELSYGGLYRVIPLPSNVDSDSTKASYKNGVLEIRLRKSRAKKVTKKVEVE